jgi:hypothetical protein
MHPAILNFKPTRDEIVRSAGHQDRIGRAHGLNARGNIWRIAKDIDFTATAITDDHRAAVDPDANQQLDALLASEAPIPRFHSFDDREPGTNRALSIILIRSRPTKVDEKAIA